MAKKITQHPLLSGFVDRLQAGAGDRLLAVVLYGSAARGDFHERTSDFNLLIELSDLELETLATLADPVAWWLRKHQPMPRIFSPKVIAEAADVFPIEFLDISSHHVALHGKDPFEGLEIHTDHLRIQCERELREKLMRVREAYIEARGKPRLLQKLLADSYPTFIALFRGCLHLAGRQIPAHNAEVAEAFCALADIDKRPFVEIEELLDRDRAADDAGELFSRYYRELVRAVAAIDGFQSHREPAAAREGEPS
jgi:predicted nucleotidyltransferase